MKEFRNESDQQLRSREKLYRKNKQLTAAIPAWLCAATARPRQEAGRNNTHI